jgi:hypothetical protein
VSALRASSEEGPILPRHRDLSRRIREPIAPVGPWLPELYFRVVVRSGPHGRGDRQLSFDHSHCVEFRRLHARIRASATQQRVEWARGTSEPRLIVEVGCRRAKDSPPKVRRGYQRDGAAAAWRHIAKPETARISRVKRALHAIAAAGKKSPSVAVVDARGWASTRASNEVRTPVL